CDRLKSSAPPPVKFRAAFAAVRLERTALAHGIRPLEDPVLPRREPAEDFRFERLGAGKPEISLHARQRIRRERRALLDRHPYLIVPVQIVRRERHEPGLE